MIENAENEPRKGTPPPPTFSEGPEAELEERLRKNPQDSDAKVDVGSDESMDASDPPAAVQPDASEPVPSSGFETDDDRDSERT